MDKTHRDTVIKSILVRAKEAQGELEFNINYHQAELASLKKELQKIEEEIAFLETVMKAL